jgi:D-galactose 1-dehydrogenase
VTAPSSYSVAIVGVGKIARDQHIPSIGRSPRFTLAAGVIRHGRIDGVDNFGTIEAFLAARPDVPAVALCTPPQVRCEMAEAAIRAGRHVLLEKPPGATLSEVEWLSSLAADRGVTLFATWHSRFAPAVEPARAILADRTITDVEIVWKEDVRRWHPGQAWIWEPGGLGVFDPGINALSVVTAILPRPIRITAADLDFPENRDTPIAARIAFTDGLGTPVRADFDWRQEGPQTWDIVVKTDTGTLTLSHGGSTLAVDGVVRPMPPEAEYDGIYARFADLLDAGASDVDIAPFRHVADAFMLGKRIVTAPFFD